MVSRSISTASAGAGGIVAVPTAKSKTRGGHAAAVGERTEWERVNPPLLEPRAGLEGKEAGNAGDDEARDRLPDRVQGDWDEEEGVKDWTRVAAGGVPGGAGRGSGRAQRAGA